MSGWPVAGRPRPPQVRGPTTPRIARTRVVSLRRGRRPCRPVPAPSKVRGCGFEFPADYPAVGWRPCNAFRWPIDRATHEIYPGSWQTSRLPMTRQPVHAGRAVTRRDRDRDRGPVRQEGVLVRFAEGLRDAFGQPLDRSSPVASSPDGTGGLAARPAVGWAVVGARNSAVSNSRYGTVRLN
jgi:hypothetical protein